VRGFLALHWIAAAALAIPAYASADEVTSGPQPPRRDCALAESVPLNITQFKASPRRYGGRCVHVRGIIAQRGFVRDRRELYTRRMRDWGPQIAVYGPENDTTATRQLWTARTYADIVAYAYSCAELSAYAAASAERANAEARARAKPGEAQSLFLPFVPGLCHYSSGPVLLISQWTALPDLPTRLVDRASARRYRNLDEVDKRWPRYAEVHALIVKWIDLVRQNDISALTQFIRDRGPYGCICKTRDCAGQWPINSIDTNAAPEWPFVCLNLFVEPGEPAELYDYPSLRSRS
jgi:hypothetical protein